MNREQIANKYNLSLNNHNDSMIINAMVAIKKHNMEKWIREFDEVNGFLMSNHNNIIILHEELADDAHSGASAACTLRQCQALLTKEYNNDLELTDIENENEEIPETIEGSGKSYGLYNSMDEHNKKAMDIVVSHGMESAVDFMTKGIKDGTMDYATMRSLYG